MVYYFEYMRKYFIILNIGEMGEKWDIKVMKLKLI